MSKKAAWASGLGQAAWRRGPGQDEGGEPSGPRPPLSSRPASGEVGRQPGSGRVRVSEQTPSCKWVARALHRTLGGQALGRASVGKQEPRSILSSIVLALSSGEESSVHGRAGRELARAWAAGRGPGSSPCSWHCPGCVGDQVRHPKG